MVVPDGSEAAIVALRVYDDIFVENQHGPIQRSRRLRTLHGRLEPRGR